MNGALVAKVEKGSQAFQIGIRPGDRLVSINGRPVVDIIEYQLAFQEDHLEMELQRGGHSVNLSFSPNFRRPFGVTFESAIFDGVRRCRNRCVFCFVDQMPAGCRSTLKIKDDDFRLSFFGGNFITLTNLTSGAVERIVSQRLSPLYVSVHSVNPEVRAKLMRPRGEDPGLRYLRMLVEAGVELHTQIVLCPGLNDGSDLESTLSFLTAQERVLSVGIVPVGLTGHRRGLPTVTPVDKDLSLAVLEQVNRWRDRLRRSTGRRKVFLADEFYLVAGRPLPKVEEYEGFPQLENGIGLSRLFLDELRLGLRNEKLAGGNKFTALTSRLAATVVDEALSRIKDSGGPKGETRVVKSTFFGGGVSVAGLMAGREILDAVRSIPGEIWLPDICLNEQRLFIDDLSFEEVSEAVDGRLRLVPSSGEKLAGYLRQLKAA